MAKGIQGAVEWAVKIAEDDSHGYDQEHRNGPDYDCSSFISTALYQAGFKISPYSWTGNMFDQLINCGFHVVSSALTRKPGDIHLTPGHHVAMSVDKDRIVHARINEQGHITGGKKGDQTGNEIAVTPYYTPSYGWSYHLRYDTPGKDYWNLANKILAGEYGNYPDRKECVEGDGFEYQKAQDMVNAIIIARDVIRGRWGNNPEREQLLKEHGYNPQLVQQAVNRIMGV